MTPRLYGDRTIKTICNKIREVMPAHDSSTSLLFSKKSLPPASQAFILDKNAIRDAYIR